MIRDRISLTADFFSVDILLRTLFSPYKQISADESGITLNDKMQVVLDNLLSRVIGAIIRCFMIIAGFLTMLLQLVFSIVLISFWLIAPLLPIVGLVMMAIKWMPIWMN